MHQLLKTFKWNAALKLTLCSVFFISFSSQANITLPAVISDNMVLQQKDSVKIWGWASPAEKIFITPSWNNQTDSVIASGDARWEISIPTPAAGGPYTIHLKGQNTITLKNVMIGEVWICSGQSNMEWSYQHGVPQMKEEFPLAGNLNIRFFTVPKTTSENPQDDCRAEWVQCDSNTLKSFSAIAYYFGKKLNHDLNTPIGLINSSWGGTPAEVWTPAEIVNENPELRKSAELLKPLPWWTVTPGYAFNGMVAPLTNYTIRGAIWYQGESNTAAPATYSRLFTEMIKSWREKWDNQFPFYYVQIAPFTYGQNNLGALVREQQTKSLELPGTGMVVISDLVDDTANIHPTNKRDVGLRLANMALAKTYQKEVKAYQSPLFEHMTIEKNKAIISFKYAPDGIVSKDKKITQLTIAGPDGLFYPAEGRIRKGKLTVTSKEVPNPIAVRYQFSNAGIGNLTSKEGLPVAPFRTDEFPQ